MVQSKVRIKPYKSNSITATGEAIYFPYPHNFPGIVKLKRQKVKLHIDLHAKPAASQQRSIPYRLKDRKQTTI